MILSAFFLKFLLLAEIAAKLAFQLWLIDAACFIKEWFFGEAELLADKTQ